MPFLKQFNPEIDWTTSANFVNRYIIPLVDYKAYISNSRLEIVSAEAFVKDLKQGKYTCCVYIDSIQTVPQQVGHFKFTYHAAYGSGDKGASNISTDPQLAKWILSEL